MAQPDPYRVLDQSDEYVDGDRRRFLKRLLGTSAAVAVLPLMTSKAAAQEEVPNVEGEGRGDGKGRKGGKGGKRGDGEKARKRGQRGERGNGGRGAGGSGRGQGSPGPSGDGGGRGGRRGGSGQRGF